MLNEVYCIEKFILVLLCWFWVWLCRLLINGLFEIGFDVRMYDGAKKHYK